MSYKESDIPSSARTAITRHRPSALAKTIGELFTSTDMVFDWGCGKGCDVQYYLSKVDTVCGWDPHFAPIAHPKKLKGIFNIVACSCVLNVLTKQERKECLQSISNFLGNEGTAYFSVRSKQDIDQNRKDTWEKKGDGWVTSIGTFQHGFTQDELLKLIKPYFKTVDIIKTAPIIVRATNDEKKN